MRVGYGATFQNPGEEIPDEEVYRQEIRMARMAEPLGFDSVWSTEHHFTGYQMVPDVLQFLSYMAGTSDTLELGSMVVVIPWHNPLRVAEQISVLDHYCDGRLLVGFGRGAGPTEYEGLGRDMGKAREMFVEFTDMIHRGLETGICEYDGEVLTQARVEIRPRPARSFRNRLFAGVASPGSIQKMAKPGFGILIVPQRPWEDLAVEFSEYREEFRATHGRSAPAPIATAWVFCDEDPARAEEVGARYLTRYWRTVLAHYEYSSPERFRGIKGYENYVGQAQAIKAQGDDSVAKDFMNVQVWGTPEQCIEKIRGIHDHVACQAFTGIFRFADMPYDEARRNLRTFAEKVLPAIKKLGIPD